MTLRNRLRRLEARTAAGGRCPSFPRTELVSGRRSVGGAFVPDALPLPCPACGRPGEVVEVFEVVVGGHDADRPREGRMS
jgi:hypothetical protein